jgi:vanillate/3-O-methylgallate O-demethylase
MPETLQDRIDSAGGIPQYVNHSVTPLIYPYPPAYTNWRDEQRAWHDTAVLFDQSYHMVDLYIKGPDTLRLLSDTAVNTFKNFGRNKAKQYLAVNEHGFVIADAILFGLEDDEVSVVGTQVAPDWLKYRAEQGGYDVTITYDNNSPLGPGPRLLYRYEIEGPNAWKILQKAHGGPLEHIKFFTMDEFTIARHRVRALNHTMGGLPGDDSTGLEVFGPSPDGPDVLAAILAAGEEFGLVRGGQDAYLSTVVESGWISNPTPAIYSEDLRKYREWLPASGMYDWLRPSGSFRSDNVEDYYLTPWDLGYGRTIRFDHDFTGRTALEAMAADPTYTSRGKVWLRWNLDDVVRLLAGTMFDGDRGARPLDEPIMLLAYDQVLIGEERVGFAMSSGYTVNLNEWVSLATVDLSRAPDGTEVEILWGEPTLGIGDPRMAQYAQTRIRATVSTSSPIAQPAR